MNRKRQPKKTEAVELKPRRRFLVGLLTQSEDRTALGYKLLPSSPDFISASAGVGGLSFRFVVGMDASRVELYIAHRDAKTNKRLYDELLSHKAEIQDAFRERLSWERLEDSKSCRIAYRSAIAGAADEASWREAQAALVDAMVRFERAVLPFISALK
jgi:hypothetical protein